MVSCILGRSRNTVEDCAGRERAGGRELFVGKAALHEMFFRHILTCGRVA